MDFLGTLPSANSPGVQTLIANKGDGDGEPEPKDIYRGDPALPPRSRPTSPVASTYSWPTSSGWSGLELRRGALRVILEKAISRWARATSGSSTVSSTSSVSSPHNQRRKRRPSIATSHTTHTETIIRARRQAWEQGRSIPREFLLFLPLPLVVDHSSQDKRIFRSASLPLVISQVDSAIKRTAKLRRSRNPSIPSGKQSSVSPSHTLQDKGKSRDAPPIRTTNGNPGSDKSRRRPAWWLDVSNPTWNDMREIGQLLHIHPLTLEDILQQEPREKLEVFPRLGYYFIVFRALESERTRATAWTQLDMTMKGDNSVIPFTNGTIGATNVYIVVFRDGICTFHYQDISEHTSRVRNRIMQLEEAFHASSDWIAHGVLDSIVDQFFPLLDSIEREIKDLDHIVFSISGPLRNRGDLKHRIATKRSTTQSNYKEDKEVTFIEMEKINAKDQTEPSSIGKMPTYSIHCAKSFSSGTRHTPIPIILKVKQWLMKLSRFTKMSASPSPLVRMASTRRLVTSLTRLLGSKSEVVSQTRKRLSQGAGLTASDSTLSEQGMAGEVGIYLGDIQDHILTLQQSLAYYERMLGDLHPAYLSHLRVSLAEAKAGMDGRLFYLSLFGVSIMLMQIVTGICSLNVNMPRNNRAATPAAPFHYFGGVVFVEFLLAAVLVLLTRWWWTSAEQRFTRARGAKF